MGRHPELRFDYIQKNARFARDLVIPLSRVMTSSKIALSLSSSIMIIVPKRLGEHLIACLKSYYRLC
jgi:hypothetical protein